MISVVAFRTSRRIQRDNAGHAPHGSTLRSLCFVALCCPCAAEPARALHIAGRSSRPRARLAAGAWAWTAARGCVALSSDHHECSDARLRFCKAAICCWRCHLSPPAATRCSTRTRRGLAAASSHCRRQGEARIRVCINSRSLQPDGRLGRHSSCERYSMRDCRAHFSFSLCP
jgi:hypothetical protein